MIEIDNVIWDNLRLSWYDNNHNLVTDEYERNKYSDYFLNSAPMGTKTAIFIR